MNKVLLYRKSIGYTQKDIADLLNISEGTYRSKEKGLSMFKSDEMEIFLDLVKKNNPSATIEDIFFNFVKTKKRRKEVKQNA